MISNDQRGLSLQTDSTSSYQWTLPLSLDTYPIQAKARENNLKTSVKKRFCKETPLRHDPGARLGVIAAFPSAKKKV